MASHPQQPADLGRSSTKHRESICRMSFKVGDRVLMIRHADWKSDAAGTIVGGPRQRKNSRGEWYDDYMVEFDEPQKDLTDELNGDHERSYSSSTVAAPFLLPHTFEDPMHGHG